MISSSSMRLLFPFLLVTNVLSYQILVYSPSFGFSHTNFMAKLADTLTDAGHDVTFLVPVVDESRKEQFGVKTTKDVVIVEQDKKMLDESKNMDEENSVYWTLGIDSSNADAVLGTFEEAMILACNNFLRNRHVFDEMKSRHFDVAIVEPISMCGLGYVNALGIEKTIVATSGTLFDGALDAVGESLDLSHVPGFMSKSGERMTLLERLENYRMSRAMVRLEHKMWDGEMAIYRKHLGQHLPNWRELLPAASVFFTNSIPFVDFPRLVSQKTVPIGGISVDMEAIRSQKLSDEWSAVLEKRPHSMLISFGSMMRSMDMPKHWRAGLLEAIRSEPNVTFIWKYENADVSFADGVPNIHFSPWLPQTALLNDERLTAFVTHGGLGSTNELAHLGKPALMVPVGCDQNRNANMLARNGGVVVIMKEQLAHVETVKKAIRAVLYEPQFKENAVKLAEMLTEQPVTPKELVVKYTEFVAKYGPFPQMDSFGRRLGFVERHLLDVHLLIAAPYCLFIVILIAVACFLVSMFSTKVVKKDKTN